MSFSGSCSWLAAWERARQSSCSTCMAYLQSFRDFLDASTVPSQAGLGFQSFSHISGDWQLWNPVRISRLIAPMASLRQHLLKLRLAFTLLVLSGWLMLRK